MTCVKSSTDSYRSLPSIGRDGTRVGAQMLYLRRGWRLARVLSWALRLFEMRKRWNQNEVDTHRYLDPLEGGGLCRARLWPQTHGRRPNRGGRRRSARRSIRQWRGSIGRNRCRCLDRRLDWQRDQPLDGRGRSHESRRSGQPRTRRADRRHHHLEQPTVRQCRDGYPTSRRHVDLWPVLAGVRTDHHNRRRNAPGLRHRLPAARRDLADPSAITQRDRHRPLEPSFRI